VFLEHFLERVEYLGAERPAALGTEAVRPRGVLQNVTQQIQDGLADKDIERKNTNKQK
jgi:hypothetical protein